MKFKNTLLSLAIGFLTSNAHALSLGEAHGNVVLGRPIDLVFDIYTDPGTDLDITCIQASAQAGENTIDNSRLRIAALPLIAGRPPSVRIRSSVAVLEPILTMRLSVGCAGSVVVRSYDFFADVPTALAASKLPLVITPQGASTAAAPPAVPTSSPRQSARPSAPAPAPAPAPDANLPALFPFAEGSGDTAAVAPKPAKPAKAAKPPKERAADAPVAAPDSAAAAPAVPRKSRLTVEPLRLSLALQDAPQDTPQDATSAQRTQAAALWQLLNLSAQDVQQTQLRLQQLQGEIDAARASREKLQATVTALQMQVNQMDIQRFPAALLYSLLGLLVVICAALVWMWQRLGPRSRSFKRMEPSESDWSYAEAMQDKDKGPAYAPPADSDQPDSGKMALAKPSHAAPLSPSVPSGAAPLAGKTAALASAQAPLAHAPAAALAGGITAAAALNTKPAALAPAIAAAVRMLHPEDLFDLQQQAEFFISVGEHEQAIGVMKKHIEENATASPLMYLELLRLYRSLGRRDDFKALRAQFQQHFNAVVPEFLAFQAGGRTLMDYADVAASIEAVWSADAVRPLLESYIFCPAEGCTSTAEPFELPAYDDLLLLYALANTTPASERGAPPPRQRTMPYADAAVLQPEPEPKSEPKPEPEPEPEPESERQSPAQFVDTIDPFEQVNPFDNLDKLDKLDKLDNSNQLEQDLMSPAPVQGMDGVLDFDLSPFMDVKLSGLSEVPQAAELPDAPKALKPQDFHIDMDMDMGMDMGLDAAGLELEPKPVHPLAPPSNLIEFDSQWLSPGNTLTPVSAPEPEPEPAPSTDASEWVLDLDLSEPAPLEIPELPILTDSYLPPLEATPPPAPGQPIGFGAISDRFEASFDLEEDVAKRRKF